MSMNEKWLWALRVILALMFAIPGLFKMFGDPLWVAEFARIGWGMWFMYAVAAIELGAAILVLRPATTVVGIGAMMLVTLGALVAQVALFENFIHIAVYATILVGAWAVFRSSPVGRALRS